MYNLDEKIAEKGIELAKLYPNEATYGSRANLWSCGLKDGVVSEKLYEEAKKFYGRLWTYVGD